VATRLLIVGNDTLGRRMLPHAHGIADLDVAVDASFDWRRVAGLVRSGRLPLKWLLTMAWAEWRRPSEARAPVPAVRSNRDLLARIENGVRDVFLFRAGLIVNQTVLASGARVFNIHCASLPAYGGIGTILRALRDGAYAQTATLHRVTSRIDEGEVLATEPYVLDPSRSYRENEDAAYAAGIRLLEDVLKDRRAFPAA
jgi:Formyl transferase